MTSKSGRVRSFKIDPENLSDVNLGAAEIPADFVEESTESQATENLNDFQTMSSIQGNDEFLSDDEFEALFNEAKEQELMRAQKRVRSERIRVKLNYEQAQFLNALGWKAPEVNYYREFLSEGTSRCNSCAGAVAYGMLGIVLRKRGTIHLAEIARIWAKEGQKTRPCNSIIQTLANRMGKKLIMNETIIRIS